MTSFDFCKKCMFRRLIDGYKGEDDYIQNGWVKYEYRVVDNNGVRSSISNWVCPVCDEEDRRQEEKELLMRIASVKDPRTLDEPGPYGSTREP